MRRKRPVTYKGRKIRYARLKAGIGSQKELAKRAGIAPCIISDLERGRRPLSPDWGNRIAEVTGVYAKDLVE